MNALGFLSLFKTAFDSWREDKAARLGAALAYYTIFSIPPFLILVIGILGLVFDHEAFQGRVVNTIQGLVGPEGASVIRDVLRSAHRMEGGIWPTIVGIVTLVLGASGVFGHLKDSLDTVWEVAPKPGQGIRSFVRQYFFSILVLLGTGFLLLVSLALQAILSALGDYLGRALPGGAGLWQVLNACFSLAVIAILFALMFRYIPDAVVSWEDALVGGAVTSFLFTTGESLIGVYLGRTSVGSAFGVAGSLVVLLVWVYFSSLIFFYGAEFTKVYADRYGSRIVPAENAVPVTEEARAQQGMPREL